jgi:O-antigen ligase
MGRPFLSEMQSRIPRSLLRNGRARWHTGGVPVGLVSILLLVYGLGVVVLSTTGRVDLVPAITLLVVPAAAALAVVRPEWILLVVALLPPSVMGQVPPTQMTAVLLVTLFGFLLQGQLHLGLKTGIYPLVGIIAMAIAMKADTPADATAAADTLLKLLVYYTLLMLAAFQATANERLRVDSFANALLWGVVGATILQPFLGGLSGFEGISRHPYAGPFANLAVIGFGVAYVRFSLSPSIGRRRSPWDGLLMIAFLGLTIVGYNRAAFIAALLSFALVSLWTGRKSIWIVASLVVALGLTIPTVGEAIAPGGSIDITDQQTLEQVTSGRSVLWEDLWDRGVEAMPFGNGWGYVWSLTSIDIFGVEGEFGTTGDQGFIYPHNDFLFLFVELGVIGFGFLVVFWFQLLRRFRVLSRAPDGFVRYDARILAPILVLMFLLQVFANGLSIRFVAERSFIAAGLICGMHYVMQRAQFSGDAFRRSVQSSH